MKRLFLVCLMLMFSTMVYADVYVLYDKDTLAVISLSEQDDAVNQNSSQIKEDKIKDVTIAGLALEYQDTEYQLINKALVPDMAKIAARVAAEQIALAKSGELRLIRNKSYHTACLALEGSGTIFSEINCSDFE